MTTDRMMDERRSSGGWVGVGGWYRGRLAGHSASSLLSLPLIFQTLPLLLLLLLRCIACSLCSRDLGRNGGAARHAAGPMAGCRCPAPSSSSLSCCTFNNRGAWTVDRGKRG